MAKKKAKIRAKRAADARKANRMLDRVLKGRLALESCPRCGKKHADLEVKKLKRPMKLEREAFDRWASCPKTGEPILIRDNPTMWSRVLSVLETVVIKRSAESIAREVDKEMLQTLTTVTNTVAGMETLTSTGVTYTVRPKDGP